MKNEDPVVSMIKRCREAMYDTTENHSKKLLVIMKRMLSILWLKVEARLWWFMSEWLITKHILLFILRVWVRRKEKISSCYSLERIRNFLLFSKMIKTSEYAYDERKLSIEKEMFKIKNKKWWASISKKKKECTQSKDGKDWTALWDERT